ncbi:MULTISPECIES: sensor histidine kinase [Mucilaginibacter]|jgi:sensor histidine kinase YesM|uniref:sensor histidine kinase n=1 Tax=Mucilaginibacter TaxID=423349 RepID=UPI00159E994B|nr:MULTISPECIES: sensor histidine kinase [Mucilaginibacter]NVM64096.1 sensor histidine kinase YesM [Mucilaginibacter sp. SG538B]
MQLFKTRPSITQLQLLIWLAVSLLLFFSYLPMDGAGQSAVYTIVNTTFYAAIIYGNILFLYPVFYQKEKYIWYVLLVIIFLVATGVLRGYSTLLIYNTFFAKTPEHISQKAIINYVSGGVLIFIMSLIFRIAIAYFKLKQQTEEIMIQKSQAELNLLKSQVQPHFLFNTLNNIYYEAYREAPRTAALIERLSDIMRYFVDESPKDDVAIGTEVQFIENYIALEKIRIRHEVVVFFEKNFNSDLRIPPMLLMTFVENIFKHGIDKSSEQNLIGISLVQQGDYLFFKTNNAIHTEVASKRAAGFGIVNLTKRLTMLYGSNFDLKIDKSNNTFAAFLKIPIA